MNRRALGLVLGVALPTVLLGAGWTAASLREREALRREQEQLLTSQADAVRGAVDESLEELRRREDGRPFYLYNPIYSPPELSALNDPVAPSPLALPPTDERLIGYFQLDPGGQVRTPYDEEASLSTDAEGRAALAARVSRLLGQGDFDELRALSFSNEDLSNETPPSSPLLASIQPTKAPNDEAQPDPPPRRPRARSRPRPVTPVEEPVVVSAQEPPTPSTPSTDRAGQANQEQLVPQGPLTTTLNSWNQEVARDIQQAQAGDPEANFRMQSRGRAAPIIRRNTVTWGDVLSQSSSGNRAQASQPREPEPASGWVNQPRSSATAPLASAPAPAPRAPRRPRVAPRPPPPPPRPSLINPDNQNEVEVDYTRMTWRGVDDDLLVLHRLVSHQGTAVVQGVLVDRRHLVERWIPQLVARHTLRGEAPRVTDRGQGEDCALRRPASELLEGVELCYSQQAVARATVLANDDLHWQVAALAGLVLIVTLAGLTMYRGAQRALELSAQKSAFVSSVSHELRTPLTTIRMHAEMLREGLVPEDKRDRFHRQLVHESVRLSQLVENVLELSRLEEGRRVLRPQLGDLGAAVAGVVAQQRPFVEEKGFRLEMGSREGAEPVTVSFDAQAISQVVINLVDNAVKYGGGEEKVVEVEVAAEGEGGLIVVRDRGPGVPAAERERVFERFHRVRDKEREHMPGTGIGLSLVRELARAHGGDAEVRERPGGGCEARVFLPAETSHRR